MRGRQEKGQSLVTIRYTRTGLTEPRIPHSRPRSIVPYVRDVSVLELIITSAYRDRSIHCDIIQHWLCSVTSGRLKELGLVDEMVRDRELPTGKA
jgi:hypothetical protein